MAAENELEVIFGADDKSLSKTIASIQADLKTFNSQLQKVGDVRSFDELNTKLATTKTNVERIKGAGLADQLTKIRPGASQATTALTNLSRVAQDMPFGFIAIANNLDPLFESFGRLGEATKNAGGPLKALGAAMIGPAGIGVAIASISSLITVAIQKYGSLGNAINEVFGLIDNSIKASRTLNETLASSGAAVAGEVAAVEALLSIARDENKTKAVRQQAIDKLNDSYDKYLPNLSLETIATQKVTDAVDKLNKSLIRQAQIKGLQDLISKETATQADSVAKALNNESSGFEKVIDILKEAVDLSHVSQSIKRLHEYGKAFDQAGERANIFKGILKNLLTEEAENKTLFIEKPKKEKVGKTLAEVFANIQKDQDKLFGDLLEFSNKESDKYFADWEKNITANDKRQAIIDAFAGTNDAIKKGIVGISARGGTNDILSGSSLDAFNAQRIEEFNKLFRSIGQNPPDVSWVDDLGAKATLLNAKWLEVSSQFHVTGEMITGFLQPAFASLFDTLLSGSVSASQALRNFFLGLIKQIVATIAQAVALAAVMSALGFGGFNKLFKGFMGIGGSGGGGGMFSGGAGPSGLAFAGAATGSSFGSQLNFRLDGNDLVASINRTNQSNGRMGG